MFGADDTASFHLVNPVATCLGGETSPPTPADPRPSVVPFSGPLNCQSQGEEASLRTLCFTFVPRSELRQLLATSVPPTPPASAPPASPLLLPGALAACLGPSRVPLPQVLILTHFNHFFFWGGGDYYHPFTFFSLHVPFTKGRRWSRTQLAPPPLFQFRSYISQGNQPRSQINLNHNFSSNT